MATRFLFTCRPLTGHYLPLVSIALAAREAGHTVAFATGAPILDEAEAAGFETFEAGVGTETREQWGGRFAGYHRLVGDEQRKFFFAQIFADLELVPRARDLDGIVSSWQPDVVVHEVAELAAPLVCTAAGIPYADVGYGSLIARSVLEAAGAAAAPHWRDRGLEPHRFAGLFRHLYLDPCPPALQSREIDAIENVQSIRPVAAGRGGASIPRRTPSDRPTVYVTMGTVWNRDLDRFRQLLDAVAREQLDVVVTVGHNNDPADLGPQPANVAVHRWIAQEELLPRCDLVIMHGGSGTMLGALAHGLPLLVIPQGADQWSNAERVVAAGAGQSLLADEVNTDSLRAAVTALLKEPEYRNAAALVAQQIAAMPAPAEALPALERLIAD